MYDHPLTLPLEPPRRQNYEQFIIDLSSPTTSDEQFDDLHVVCNDSEDDQRDSTNTSTASSDKANATPPRHIFLEQTVNALLSSPTPNVALIHENTIIHFLDYQPLTPPDVHILSPILAHKRWPRLLHAIARSIGYAHAYGYLSTLDLEQILEIILVKGDEKYDFYAHVKSVIAAWQYQANKTNFDMEQAWHHTQHLQKHVSADNEVFAGHKADGAKLTDKTIHNSLPHRQKPTPRRTNMPSTPAPPQSSNPTPFFPEESGHWARSRLHNGPGLEAKTRRAKWKVRLPAVDERGVVTTPEDLRGPEGKVDHMWAKTKGSSSELFVRRRREKIVVRMPPRND
jgi:hypothetical protein